MCNNFYFITFDNIRILNRGSRIANNINFQLLSCSHSLEYYFTIECSNYLTKVLDIHFILKEQIPYRTKSKYQLF